LLPALLSPVAPGTEFAEIAWTAAATEGSNRWFAAFASFSCSVSAVQLQRTLSPDAAVAAALSVRWYKTLNTSTRQKSTARKSRSSAVQ